MMICPKCHSKLDEDAERCSRCGFDSFRNDDNDMSGSESSRKPRFGLGRTISSEFVEREAKLHTIKNFNALIERRTYKVGEVIIQHGELKRDLFILTKGSVEISLNSEDGGQFLNEIEPPYVLGDIAFLTGFSRTATATAKTNVECFLLRYEILNNFFEEFPVWLQPLLTSLVSSIKSVHLVNSDLKREINELKKC